ncbi:MAG: hypothetical protein WCB19_03030 [Thermoplasmata archaeon]
MANERELKETERRLKAVRRLGDRVIAEIATYCESTPLWEKQPATAKYWELTFGEHGLGIMISGAFKFEGLRLLPLDGRAKTVDDFFAGLDAFVRQRAAEYHLDVDPNATGLRPLTEGIYPAVEGFPVNARAYWALHPKHPPVRP